MNIDDITKRIDDSFGVDIKDIYGRRVYPGDLVYYSEIDSRVVKLGIVSKLTKTGCKILNCNKIFTNNEICIVNGNENASLAYKEKHEKELKQFNKDSADKKAVKKKSIVFIERTKDDKIFLGQAIFRFCNTEEMKERMSSFMNSGSRIYVLCKDENGNPCFSNDIFDKRVYFQPMIHTMFSSDDEIYKIEYITSSLKMKWADEIEDDKLNIKKDMNGYGSNHKIVNFISKKEEFNDNDSHIINVLYDEDFLFISKNNSTNKSYLTIKNRSCSFVYYWLTELCSYFYKVHAKNRFMIGYYSDRNAILKNMFDQDDEFNQKQLELYMFLKYSLQNI